MKSKETPPFAPTLMESTRAIGYSLEAAIADIVDNSIAAKSGKVQISFFPIGDAYVCILDDGAGMDAAAIDIELASPLITYSAGILRAGSLFPKITILP